MKLDTERESEHALLEEGRARIARLRSFATVSPCCSDGSRVGASASRVGQRSHTGSPTPQSSPGGFCPQHSGRGCMVDAMQAARHGGRDCPRFRRGCLQVGACHRRGSNSVASVDTTTLVSGELSHVSEVTPRVRTLYGLRGQRIGEANNPDDRRHDVLIDESRSHSRYGLRGVRVGEASHPGPLRRQSSRPIVGRDVFPRIH